MVEPDRTSAKRRRRTRYTPVARDHGTRSVPGSECVAAYSTRLIARFPTQCIENEDPKTYRERMLLILLEFFNVHAMYVASLSCLCPLRDGRRAL